MELWILDARGNTDMTPALELMRGNADSEAVHGGSDEGASEDGEGRNQPAKTHRAQLLRNNHSIGNDEPTPHQDGRSHGHPTSIEMAQVTSAESIEHRRGWFIRHSAHSVESSTQHSIKNFSKCSMDIPLSIPAFPWTFYRLPRRAFHRIFD